jgi:TP901 family phage tail tape measure protein
MAKDYKINISAHGAEKSQKQISGLTKGLGKMAAMGTAVFGSIKLLTAGFRAINDAMKKTAEMASASVNAYAKLEKGIAEIRTLTGGLGESVDVLREQMIEMGNATGQSFDVLTKAKYDIVSAGFGDAADSVLVFNESMKLAIGGVTDGATAVDLMTTALNSFNKDATQSADVSDVLFQTVKMGKTTIEELSSSFGRALPFAKSLGVTLEDTGTMMAFLTSKGINTAEATTSLSAMFRSLESPAQEAANMMAFYNIEVMRLEDGTVDLIETLKQFEGMDAKIISKMIPEARAQLAIKSLSGDIGTLQEMISGMEQRGDAAKTAFDIMSQTWSFKFDQIKQKIQGESNWKDLN